MTTKFGHDSLGGVKYTSALITSQIPGDVGGIFLRTFGWAGASIERMLKSNKWSELVIHLAPFDYSHNYPISKIKKQLIEDAEWCEKMQIMYPHTQIAISPMCENKHDKNTLIPLFNELIAHAPNCLFVNSSMNGVELPGVITEIHLTNSKKLPPVPKGEYTVSFDGWGGNGEGDYSDADIESIIKKYSRARHIRCWDFRYNGKCNHEDKTPIGKRKYWPDVPYLKSRRVQLKLREGAKTWKKGLYKCVSDDHGAKPPTKDNKALAILDTKAESLDVLDSNNKKIATLNRYKPDHADGRRFYYKGYNFELGNLAEKNTKSRLIRVRAAGWISPATDADLRSGKTK